MALIFYLLGTVLFAEEVLNEFQSDEDEPFTYIDTIAWIVSSLLWPLEALVVMSRTFFNFLK